MHNTNNKNKNIKYLGARDRSRYYKLIAIDHNKLTDSDVSEIADLEMRADRLGERDKATSMKRVWEGG